MEREIKELRRLLRGMPNCQMVVLPSKLREKWSESVVRGLGGEHIITTPSLGIGEFIAYAPDTLARLLDILEKQDVTKPDPRLRITNEQVITAQDWDVLVTATYGRPYCFQQQDGCRGRGVFKFSVPDEEAYDHERDTIPEVVNHEERGVSFAAWLARDPKQPLGDPKSQEDFSRGLWWGRNFYPEFSMVANDLHAKGLLPAGEYTINIDW